MHCLTLFFPFFLKDPPTTEIYTLSLHDALPICDEAIRRPPRKPYAWDGVGDVRPFGADRKSTRLNSSHPSISYAVFCLKKKNTHKLQLHLQIKQKTYFKKP